MYQNACRATKQLIAARASPIAKLVTHPAAAATTTAPNQHSICCQLRLH
jgi:hypothetical protein